MMKMATKPGAATLALMAGLLPQAQAADAALNFSGEITAGTCRMATGDANKTVFLKEVSVPEFGSGGGGGLFTEFMLTAECTGAVSTVTFRFSGTANPEDALRFANTGTAKGVGLWLIEGYSQSTILPSGDDRVMTVVAGTAEIPLIAGYYSHNAAALAAGTFASTANVDITYK